MTNNFKVGDLAVIVGANFLTQNIGKSVELSAFVQDGDLFVGPDAQMYRHTDIGCWIVRGEGVEFRTDCGVYEGFGICEPRHLMPLPGSPVPDQARSRKVSA